MKKIFALLALVFVGWAANAQSMDNSNPSDTSHRHHGYHAWNNRNGNDTSHRKNFRVFDGNRGEAMSRFHDRGEYGRNRFRNHHRFGGEMARLHFSPEQRKQMMDINKEYRKKQSDLYKNDNLTLGAYKSQLLTLQKEKKNKMQSLLTPEQKNQIAEWKKRRAENAQVMAAAHLERMKIKLNLTDAQAATIKTQQQNMRKQMMAIRENDNLMRDQKMEQIKALVAKNKETMKSVLTPEQFSQLESMHNNMHKRFGDRQWNDK